MSFFERMMRINQPNPHPTTQKKHQSPIQMSRRDNSQEELMHSRSSCSEIEQQMPEVPQEPKTQAVYASLKPVLLSCLLPKREQLLREMMAKKRQFELKKMTNSNVAKGVELRQRLEESSFKFSQNLQVHSKPKEPIIEPVNSNKAVLTSSKAVSNTCMHSSAGKHCKKSLKQSLVLDISASSRHKQSECSSVVQRGGESLNREVMMRLLNMLQNQRNDRKDLLAMSMSNHYSHGPHEKQAPIVINNILKTPVDALNKDLIQRELKIKMLENNRLRNKLVLHPAYHPSQGLTDLSDNPLTQRSQIPHCQEFNANQFSSTKPLMKKQKISLECSRISIQSRQEVQRPELQKIDVKKEVKEQEKQTKPSSNFSSQITENDQPSKPKPRERQFKRQKQTKNQNQNQHISISQKQKVEKQSPSVIQTVIHKASVRLDIPLNDSSEGQSLTLAQAFKKRIGKLKTQKEKSKKVTIQNKTPSVQIINDQNYVKTQLYPQYQTPKQPYLPLFPLQSSQTVNLQKQSTKRQNPHRKETTSTRKEPETQSKNSRQPSKELIDRLIYGERAKVTKKEMYALTRKNYENLPQIQAKKKEQEKKKLEKQRLAKIRQMQRSNRSLKQIKLTLQ